MLSHPECTLNPSVPIDVEDDLNDEIETEEENEHTLFAKYPYLIKGKKATYQYVPILKSIQALLNHPQISKLYFESIASSPSCNEIRTFKDTINFQKNTLFVLNCNGKGL
jgi:hypothetical protein